MGPGGFAGGAPGGRATGVAGAGTGAGAVTVGEAAYITDAGGGGDGTLLAVVARATGAVAKECVEAFASVADATPADFEVVAGTVGLGSTGGEPPIGGGETMACGGGNRCGGNGGCSEVAAKCCRASVAVAACSASPALAEAAASAGITPAKEGRFDKVVGIAEVAGPGAASDCHGYSSSASSPRRAAATSSRVSGPGGPEGAEFSAPTWPGVPEAMPKSAGSIGRI